jgi:hypothetical protein
MSTRTLNIPWRAMVLRADPDYEREKREQVEYKFTGREFKANPEKRGAYAEE